LWGYLVLSENDRNIPVFDLKKYKKLIENYLAIEHSENPTEEDMWEPNAYGYYDASRGATTEEPQRRKRQEILERIMG
jgi:hypothetical protein